jgi:hypothetical protein
VAYADVLDMIVGDIPESPALPKQKYIDDAADEIDSKIGFVYATPIDVSEGGSTPRPVRLLLKRLNAHLASGRYIMAATVNAEDENLNAYGKSLVESVELSLALIATGKMVLDDVEKETNVTLPRKGIPMISVADAESNVEAFYNRTANPNYPAPHGLVRQW